MLTTRKIETQEPEQPKLVKKVGVHSRHSRASKNRRGTPRIAAKSFDHVKYQEVI
jgi:hypothetical protein